jgi:hypothetical protein
MRFTGQIGAVGDTLRTFPLESRSLTGVVALDGKAKLFGHFAA